MEKKTEHKKHAPLARPSWGDEIPVVKGLILAGGESQRMGVDKSTIDYHGRPQRDFLLQLLDKLTAGAFLSCHPERMPEEKYPVIKDSFLDLGPYGGVLSAFRSDPNSAWLAVACDLPLVDDTTIAALIAERDFSKMATCFHDPSTGLPEPMITIWEPRAYPVLLQFLGEGISCLRKVLINTDSRMVTSSRPEVLRSANTMEEADLIRKLM